MPLPCPAVSWVWSLEPTFSEVIFLPGNGQRIWRYLKMAFKHTAKGHQPRNASSWYTSHCCRTRVLLKQNESSMTGEKQQNESKGKQVKAE